MANRRIGTDRDTWRHEHKGGQELGFGSDEISGCNPNVASLNPFTLEGFRGHSGLHSRTLASVNPNSCQWNEAQNDSLKGMKLGTETKEVDLSLRNLLLLKPKKQNRCNSMQ